jgi:MoxR-like ATPase
MKHHAKYDEVRKLIEANIAVLLTGEAGSGKTTLAMHISEDMKLKFFTMSMTRQTTLSHLLGFVSVNGNYIPSSLRKCFESGGMMLLDEIDAGDPNVLLALNTIENGYISFPDAMIKCHSDFRLVATANPQDQHNFYTGRSKLDAATLDRFDTIDVDRDDKLEVDLVDEDTHMRMQLMRKIMASNNSAKPISMRDSIRYQQRKDLGLLDEAFILRLTDKSELVMEQYNKEVQDIPKHQNQSECETLDELSDLLMVRNGSKPKPKDKNGEEIPDPNKPTPSNPYPPGE